MLFPNYLPRRLAPRIKKELKLDSRRFITDENNETTILTFFFSISEEIKKAKMQLHIRQRSYCVYAYFPIKIKEHRAEIAQLLNCINMDILNGHFTIDMHTGQIRYSALMDCRRALADFDAIDDSIYIPMQLYAQFCSGILSVMDGSSTPEDAYYNCKECNFIPQSPKSAPRSPRQ